MSDLTSELRQVADAAAHQARPQPAADVIRRGDRRRRRGIAQRSLGGLSAAGAAGLAGVMLFTGGPATSQAASGSGHPPGFTAVTDSTVSAAGTMTIHVRYQVQRHGTVRVLAVTCSGHSKVSAGETLLVFEINSRPKGKQGVDYFVAVHVKQDKNGDFSGALPVRRIPIRSKKPKALILPDNSTLQVAFSHILSPPAKPTASAAATAQLQLGMILTAGSAP